MAAAASQQTVGEQAEAQRIQAGINDCMRATIADAVGGRMYSPFRERSAGTARPADAAVVHSAPIERGSGWANEIPLASPPGQDAIAALVNKELPHGVANALSGRVSIEVLRATIAKAQAMLEKLEREEAEKKDK
jgi:hypothetical protein